MFCNNCGKELKDGAAFCSGCGTKMEMNASENQSNSENKTVDVADVKPNRDTYLNKWFTFDYYIGVNIKSLRMYRRSVRFEENILRYSKGLKSMEIPYNMIKGVKDEKKFSVTSFVLMIFTLLISLICLIGGAYLVTIVGILLAVAWVMNRYYRSVSILTTDNKSFEIRVNVKNQEIDQFLTYLKNETGIK